MICLKKHFEFKRNSRKKKCVPQAKCDIHKYIAGERREGKRERREEGGEGRRERGGGEERGQERGTRDRGQGREER